MRLRDQHYNSNSNRGAGRTYRRLLLPFYPKSLEEDSRTRVSSIVPTGQQREESDKESDVNRFFTAGPSPKQFALTDDKPRMAHGGTTTHRSASFHNLLHKHIYG